MTVSDVERSSQFLQTAFDFKLVADTTVTGQDYDYLQGVFGCRLRTATLQLGQETVRLMQYLSPPGRPVPVDSRSNDLWFQHFAIIVSDIDQAHDRLQEFDHTPISTAVATLPNGIRAYKFKDTDGHTLELLWFPPDEGKDRWQTKDRLFLGIDHSAIAVSQTDRSLAFYQDLLGLEVAGTNVNTGKAQEYMDNLFAAQAIVTSLTPAQGGLGIELLDYLTPPGGRPMPIDQRSSDLIHVQLELVVENLDDAVATLTAARAKLPIQLVSPAPVSLPDGPFARGLLVRDPDGHNLMLVEA